MGCNWCKQCAGSKRVFTRLLPWPRSIVCPRCQGDGIEPAPSRRPPAPGGSESWPDSGWAAAIQAAKQLAAEAPRVAAVVYRVAAGRYAAIPGYLDSDHPGAIHQKRLVTPDGRVWRCDP